MNKLQIKFRKLIIIYPYKTTIIVYIEYSCTLTLIKYYL